MVIKKRKLLWPITNLSEEEKKIAFYRYWVLKESFMKATRYGMKLGLDTFEILCDEKGARLLNQPKEICEKFSWAASLRL